MENIQEFCRHFVLLNSDIAKFCTYDAFDVEKNIDNFEANPFCDNTTI